MSVWNNFTLLVEMKKFLNLWLPVLLWMGVIFIGSSIGSMPKVGGRATDAIVHRIAHLIEFALLGWLVLRALSDGRLPDRRTFVIALIGAFSIATSTARSNHRPHQITPHSTPNCAPA